MSDKRLQALEDMVFQFGYRGVRDGKPIIWTGGLSALEGAFEVLGWDDPHYLPEEGFTCEVVGCMNEDTTGMHWGNSKLYLRLCSEHHMQVTARRTFIDWGPFRGISFTNDNSRSDVPDDLSAQLMFLGNFNLIKARLEEFVAIVKKLNKTFTQFPTGIP